MLFSGCIVFYERKHTNMAFAKTRLILFCLFNVFIVQHIFDEVL